MAPDRTGDLFPLRVQEESSGTLVKKLTQRKTGEPQSCTEKNILIYNDSVNLCGSLCNSV
jgi:hypothetical protein